MKTSLIVARDLSDVIGINGQLPWHCPEDLKLFKELTVGKIVVMGYNTWTSLPVKPLPNRINIVITSDVSKVVGADAVVNSVERAIEVAELFSDTSNELVFIGGKSIYDSVVGVVDEAHVSEMALQGDYEEWYDGTVVSFEYDFINNGFNCVKHKEVFDSNGKTIFDYFHFVRVK